MLNLLWPLALVVLSNTFYQICAKSSPSGVNPFATLSITYFVSTLVSVVLFFLLSDNKNLLLEYQKINWVPFVFGLTLVGLEVGFIYAYKAGWQVSVLSIVQGALLAVALIFVGVLVYKESVTLNKMIGIIICLAGLVIINLK